MMFNLVNCFYLITVVVASISLSESHYNQQQPPQFQPQQHQPPQQQQPQHGHMYNEPVYGQPQPHGGQPMQQQGQQMPPPQHQQHGNVAVNVLHDKERINDREHLKEHLGGVLSEPDLSKLSDEELQFYYFKMHDSDNNEKLDGSELIKSLIHWHVEESKHLGHNAPPSGTTKLFTDTELSQMIDPILEMDDRNRDGFIDYPEFVAAQKNRRF